MKVIIAVLFVIIATISFFAGYVILSYAGNADSPSSVEANVRASTALAAEPMGGSGTDFVMFNVTYSSPSQDSFQPPQDSIDATPDDESGSESGNGNESESESKTARDNGGLINFNLTFVGAGNVNSSFNISTPVYDYGDITVGSFVFNYDGTSSIPVVTFVPGMHETAFLFATYFVDFDIAGGTIVPHVFTIPMFDSVSNTVGGQGSMAIKFVVTFGSAQNEAIRNLFGVPVSARPEEPPENFRGSIRVLPDEDLMTELLGTWVYNSPYAHIEMTFMNDWRYYEIAYSRSGRPLFWEYGVYSIDCNTRITIQSSSIWGPEYTYSFKIDNNTMTLTHRGVAYTFTRQNPLPLLALENFPFSMWHRWDRWPYLVPYTPTGPWPVQLNDPGNQGNNPNNQGNNSNNQENDSNGDASDD